MHHRTDSDALLSNRPRQYAHMLLVNIQCLQGRRLLANKTFRCFVGLEVRKQYVHASCIFMLSNRPRYMWTALNAKFKMLMQTEGSSPAAVVEV
jgi:hypothetical protein